MTNITPILNPKTLPDKTTLTEHQIGPLDLSKLPRKVSIRVHRSNGIVQIKHVSKRRDVTLLFDLALPSGALVQKLNDLADDVLIEAAWTLNEERIGGLHHTSVGNSHIRTRS